MTTRKPDAPKAKSPRRLSVSKHTIKDLTPSGREVKGGMIPITRVTDGCPPTVNSGRRATC